MSVFDGEVIQGGEHVIPRLDFELSAACDHRCGHCYNVWNAADDEPGGGYPKGTMPTADYLAMMEKMVAQSGAQHITLTGGEPLLRPDALQFVKRACELVPTVTLITNGSHVGPERARQFKEWGLRSVQLTLLSADRDTHDALKGAACFDDTVRAALDLKDAGVPTQCCFVSMKANAGHFEGVMELCYVLGIRAVSYNRMSPTGWAIRDLDRLLPEVEDVERDLDLAESLGKAWRINVATAMPIPPCLIRFDRYEWVRFGFCSTGSHSPNIVVDPLGNVRSCNLSSHIMGNIREQAWAEIHADPYLHTFKSKLPEMCRGCAYERGCQGGCKESGFATYGDLEHPEPFVHLARNPELRAAPPPAPSTGPLVQVGEPAKA